MCSESHHVGCFPNIASQARGASTDHLGTLICILEPRGYNGPVAHLCLRNLKKGKWLVEGACKYGWELTPPPQADGLNQMWATQRGAAQGWVRSSPEGRSEGQGGPSRGGCSERDP